MQDVRLRDASPAEAPGVLVASDLEHAANDLRRVAFEEPLDVIPVDRCAAIEPVVAADRCRPAEVAEADSANGGHIPEQAGHAIAQRSRNERCQSAFHASRRLAHCRERRDGGQPCQLGQRTGERHAGLAGTVPHRRHLPGVVCPPRASTFTPGAPCQRLSPRIRTVARVYLEGRHGALREDRADMFSPCSR